MYSIQTVKLAAAHRDRHLVTKALRNETLAFRDEVQYYL